MGPLRLFDLWLIIRYSSVDYINRYRYLNVIAYDDDGKSIANDATTTVGFACLMTI